MKFDKNEILMKAKNRIDEFCSFMYFLWTVDNTEILNPLNGKVLAIIAAIIAFLVVPTLLLLALQCLWAILSTIIMHPLTAIRGIVTFGLIFALPIGGFLLCYKRGEKLKNANKDGDNEV